MTQVRVGGPDVTATQNHGATLKCNIPVSNIYDFNKDGLIGAADVTDSQTRGTTNKTGLNFINIGTGGLFAPEVMIAAAATNNEQGVGSVLASTPACSTSIAIPPWTVNRLAHLDLNHAPIANLFQHLAHEGIPIAKAILVKAGPVADALDLDDEMVGGLLVGLTERLPIDDVRWRALTELQWWQYSCAEAHRFRPLDQRGSLTTAAFQTAGGDLLAFFLIQFSSGLADY